MQNQGDFSDFTCVLRDIIRCDMTYLPRVLAINNADDAAKEMQKIGVHSAGLPIMEDKAVFRAVKLTGVSVVAANILKQDMLARGGEAATSKGTIDHSDSSTDVILMGTVAQYESLFEKLSGQQFGLPEIAGQIQKVLGYQESYPESILGMEFGRRTYIMGILNVTPDSFSDGGRYGSPEAAAAAAIRMTADGADIIDVGGESTRPGAAKIEEADEIKRIVPVIEKMIEARLIAPVQVGAIHESPVQSPQSPPRPIISVDTRKSAVAEAAVKAGANMINDISGLRFDPRMAEVAAGYKVPLIIMHSRGTPDIMQENPFYYDIISEILLFFEESIDSAVKAGVRESDIILDPGIGFGKRLEDNIEILERLEEFRSLGRPVCLGTSRKSFLGTILGQKDPSERDTGTCATISLAIPKKVDIIRVHNIKMAAETAGIADAVIRRKGK